MALLVLLIIAVVAVLILLLAPMAMNVLLDATDRDDPFGMVGPAGQRPPAPIHFRAPRFVGNHVLVPMVDAVDAYDPTSGKPVRTATCGSAGWAGAVPSQESPIAVVVCDGDYVGLDGDTGREQWRIPNLHGSRVRAGSRFLVVNRDDVTVAFDVHSGVEVWRSSAFSDAAVASDAERIYVGNDERLVAIDPATDAQLWERHENSSDLRATDDALYVRSASQRLVRLDPETGDVEWKSDAEPTRLEWSIVAAVSDEAVVLFTNDGGGGSPNAITVYDPDTGEKRWQLDLPDGNLGTAAAAAGDVVAVVEPAGHLRTYDAATGTVLRVRSTTVFEAPAAAGDRLAYVEQLAGGDEVRIVPLR